MKSIVVLTALILAASPVYSLCMKDYSTCASECMSKLDGKSCVGSESLIAEVESCLSQLSCGEAERRALSKKLENLCPKLAQITEAPVVVPMHGDLKARSWGPGPWGAGWNGDGTWTGSGPWGDWSTWSGSGPWNSGWSTAGGWGPGRGGPFGGAWGNWASTGAWTSCPFTSWWDGKDCPPGTWSGWTTGPWGTTAPWTTWKGCTATVTSTTTYTTTTGGSTITRTSVGIKVAEQTAAATTSSNGVVATTTKPSSGNYLSPNMLALSAAVFCLGVLNQLL
ncbi:hypothetical protein B0J14DRAFT_610624 [Halenospora varia]|nr:hypothetical protein B0J14DRAFT_610624 [Halenospora varia]